MDWVEGKRGKSWDNYNSINNRKENNIIYKSETVEHILENIKKNFLWKALSIFRKEEHMNYCVPITQIQQLATPGSSQFTFFFINDYSPSLWIILSQIPEIILSSVNISGQNIS